MRSLLTWWEAFWVKKNTTQLPRSPPLRPWRTCSRYMGIMDNRAHFTRNVACAHYFWHDAMSCRVRARMQYFVWQSQRHSLWKASTLWTETLGSGFKHFQVWQKTVKPAWNYEWRHHATQYPGGKEKRHQYGVVYNTSERARLHDCEKRSSGMCRVWLPEFSQVIYLLTSSYTHTQTHGDHLTEGVTVEFLATT